MITSTSPTPPSGAWRQRSGPRSKREMSGHVGHASYISCVVNLLNTIVGAGVLAMPLAMSHMGILLGSIVIFWSACMSAFGLYLQTRCARYLEPGAASFFALSQLTYPNAAIFFDAAIAIKCFGVGVSYLIIIGDLMPGVVLGLVGDRDVLAFIIDRHFWVTVFMLIVIPLAFLRRLDSLKYTSIIALISISYLIVLVVYHFTKGDTIDHYKTPLRILTWAGPVPALSSLPVIVFAYTCHQNMFSIINEITDPTPLRLVSVIGGSIGTAACVYTLVAITGYLSFGNDIAGNIIAQYKPSVASTIGKAAIVVLVMFSYPLQVHPCRASVDAVLKWRPGNALKKSKSANSTPNLDASPSRDMPKQAKPGMSDTRFAAITTGIIVLSYITAMTVSSLERVLSYVGSTGSTSISFILPGLFYYKISSPDSPAHQALLKEEDDLEYENDESNTTTRARRSSLSNEEGENQHLLANSVLSTVSAGSAHMLRRTKQWRRTMLRRLSLALAIYGVCVMITSLVTNTFFIVSEH